MNSRTAQFSVRLNGVPLRATALVAMVCLSSRAPAAGVGGRVLRGQDFSLTLDVSRKGAITSLVDTASGLDVIDAKSATDLFLLACTKPGDAKGERRWFGSSSAEGVTVRPTDDVTEIVFRRIGGRRLSATCTIARAEGSADLLFTIRVTGDASLMLDEVCYPILDLRAPLAGDGAGDAFVAGLCKGGVHHSPSQWKQGTAFIATQPGQLAAQFGCYYAPGGGLYSATRDAKGYPKSLDFRRTKSGLRWMWRRYAYHRLDEPFDLGYDVAVGTFGGAEGEATDWRDAADRYKQWALKQPWCAKTLAERDDLPAWVKSGPAMVRFNRPWLAKPERVETWLSEYWRKHFGDVPMVGALWGWEHVDSWISPKYFPPYPSEEGFTRVVHAIRRANGHPFPWPSGYHWAVTHRKRDDGTFEWDDRKDFAKTGAPHAMRQRDGTIVSHFPSWLHGGENAVLCRGDAWTRTWFNDLCAELAKRGCDMIQVDQVVGGAMPARAWCYSDQHGHPPGPGLWDMEAFHGQLRTLNERCRELQPEAVIGVEEPNELFLPHVGIQDYRDWQEQRWPNPPGLEKASLFAYLYHEYVPLFQSNPRPGDLRGMAYCLVSGQIPHMVPHWPVTPSPALSNGGFEAWNKSVPEGWQHVKGWQKQVFRGNPSRDDAIKHSGDSSLHLENANDDDIVQVSQNVDIGAENLEVGRTYRLSAWFRCEQMAKRNQINFAALTNDLRSKGAWTIPLDTTDDWTRGEATFTVPTGADFIRIMIHINGRCRLWIDDMTLEEATPDGTYREIMQSGLPRGHAFMKRWVELFHGEGRPYLLLGRTLRPPKLLAPKPDTDDPTVLPPVLLNAFRAPDRAEAAVVVNATDEAQEVRFAWRGRTWQREMEAWDAQLVRAG